MLENEVLPTVEQAVKMDVLQIKKYKNEHKLCKLERIFKQYDSWLDAWKVDLQTVNCFCYFWFVRDRS
jgi:hypothetical protein